VYFSDLPGLIRKKAGLSPDGLWCPGMPIIPTRSDLGGNRGYLVYTV